MEDFVSYFQTTIFGAMTFEHHVNDTPLFGLLLRFLYPVLHCVEQDVCLHLLKPVFPVEICMV